MQCELTERERLYWLERAVLWLEAYGNLPSCPPEGRAEMVQIHRFLPSGDFCYLMEVRRREARESLADYLHSVLAPAFVSAHVRSMIGEIEGLEGLEDEKWIEAVERQLEREGFE